MANPFIEADNRQWNAGGFTPGAFNPGGGFNAGGGFQGWEKGGKGDGKKKSCFFNEYNIADFSRIEDQFNETGQRVGFSERQQGACEMICVASSIKGLKEALRLQKCGVLFVKGADTHEETVEFCTFLQREISFDGCTREQFKFILDGVKRLMIDAGVKRKPLDEVLSRKMPTQMTNETFMQFMSEFMKAQNGNGFDGNMRGFRVGEKMEVDADDQGAKNGPQEFYVGHSDGHFDSPEGTQTVHAAPPLIPGMDPDVVKNLAEQFARHMNNQTGPPPPSRGGASCSRLNSPTPRGFAAVDPDGSGNPAEKKRAAKGKGKHPEGVGNAEASAGSGHRGPDAGTVS